VQKVQFENLHFFCTFLLFYKSAIAQFVALLKSAKKAITQSHFWKEQQKMQSHFWKVRQKVRSYNCTFEKCDNVRCANVQLSNPDFSSGCLFESAISINCFKYSTSSSVVSTFIDGRHEMVDLMSHYFTEKEYAPSYWLCATVALIYHWTELFPSRISWGLLISSGLMNLYIYKS